MATANKTPPMIAPGVLCPKCKGPVTDERANKRTEKSPDYQCANMLCTDASGKYRTGIWLEKGNGSGAETSAGGVGNAGTQASAPPVEPAPEKQKLSDIYLLATEFVIDKVLPKYTKAGIGCSDTAIVAAVATLFIAASKER